MRVVKFDRAAYDKSIEDMKKLILSRLNLDSEPSIRLNKNTMSFIDELENHILNSRGGRNHNSDDDATSSDDDAADDDVQTSQQQASAIIKTKYDMKTPQNRLFNVMHEATRVDANCLRDNDVEPSLCIYFEVILILFNLK